MPSVFPINCPHRADEILRAAGFDGEEAVPGPDGSEKIPAPRSSTRLRHQRAQSSAGGKVFPDAWRGRVDRPPRSRALGGLYRLASRAPVDRPAHAISHPRGESPATSSRLFKKLQPRLYSIASSPRRPSCRGASLRRGRALRSPGRLRQGVCSTYLAERIEENAGIFFHQNNNFRLPTDRTRDVIMIGPGTRDRALPRLSRGAPGHGRERPELAFLR